MTETLDAGPLVRQEDFSLAGSLEEIFNRIEQVGINEILSIIHEYMQTKIISTKTQDDNQSTTFKRRTPEMSEIKIEDFRNMTAQQLYNKIRALQFPYPRPYILCKDNTKLYLNETDTNE
jgi:methionyl-tRNA formyltransferase